MRPRQAVAASFAAVLAAGTLLAPLSLAALPASAQGSDLLALPGTHSLNEYQIAAGR